MPSSNREDKREKILEHMRVRRHHALSLYEVLNLLFTLGQFLLTCSLPYRYTTSLVSLQLLDSMPTAVLPSPTSPCARRAPVLASFLITLALLIGAVLTLPSCIQALFHHISPQAIIISPRLKLLHSAVHLVFLACVKALKRPSLSSSSAKS